MSIAAALSFISQKIFRPADHPPQVSSPIYRRAFIATTVITVHATEGWRASPRH